MLGLASDLQWAVECMFSHGMRYATIPLLVGVILRGRALLPAKMTVTQRQSQFVGSGKCRPWLKTFIGTCITEGAAFRAYALTWGHRITSWPLVGHSCFSPDSRS